MTNLLVNPLPSPTWNKLQVNQAQLSVSWNGGQSVTLPEAFASIKSGMGSEAEAFLLNHVTEQHRLAAKAGEKLAPVHQQHRMQAGETVADLTTIEAAENSEVVLIQSFITEDDTACTHHGLTKVIAAAGSLVRIYQVQMMNQQSTHTLDLALDVQDRARIEVIHMELGAKNDFVGLHAELRGHYSELATETIYLGDGDQKIDMNYVARHTGRKSNSHMKAAGALFGSCDKVFRGTIDFVNGCAKSAGLESEETLVFSPEVRNRTIPLILCDEEDVDGQHAASIGRIDEEKMFYLQSRGLSENQIRKLMVDAQFTPVLDKLPDEHLKQEIRLYLEGSLQFD